jgi:hypothetical protein
MCCHFVSVSCKCACVPAHTHRILVAVLVVFLYPVYSYCMGCHLPCLVNCSTKIVEQRKVAGLPKKTKNSYSCPHSGCTNTGFNIMSGMSFIRRAFSLLQYVTSYVHELESRLSQFVFGSPSSTSFKELCPSVLAKFSSLHQMSRIFPRLKNTTFVQCLRTFWLAHGGRNHLVQ